MKFTWVRSRIGEFKSSRFILPSSLDIRDELELKGKSLLRVADTSPLAETWRSR
jgi:hypothetical protein